MGHYASEMGYTSRRDVSWQKWGFKIVSITSDYLLCPLCYAMVPENKINVSNTSDEYHLPWMEHILWHEEVQKDTGSTFGWHFPMFGITDKDKAWLYGDMKRAYKKDKTLPADFLEAYYNRADS